MRKHFVMASCETHRYRSTLQSEASLLNPCNRDLFQRTLIFESIDYKPIYLLNQGPNFLSSNGHYTLQCWWPFQTISESQNKERYFICISTGCPVLMYRGKLPCFDVSLQVTLF